jgi:CheY-like chemotaxis protein
MNEETRARVFEPFFTTKPPGHGSGLGLSTAYAIVTQHDGRIDVTSIPGEGTMVEVRFPALRAAHSSQLTARPRRSPPPSPAVTAGAPAPFPGLKPGAMVRGAREPRAVSRAEGATILLVEDDPLVRQLVRELLEQQGHTVLEAPGGPDALQLVEDHTGTIDVLVTDVVMPVMNGRELATLVSAAVPGVRVLYLSGYTDDDVLRRGVETARDNFLRKPFTSEELAEKIEELLEDR